MRENPKCSKRKKKYLLHTKTHKANRFFSINCVGLATHSSVLAWRIPGTGEFWWAAVYGVAQSQTRLTQLSSSSSAGQKRVA